MFIMNTQFFNRKLVRYSIFGLMLIISACVLFTVWLFYNDPGPCINPNGMPCASNAWGTSGVFSLAKLVQKTGSNAGFYLYLVWLIYLFIVLVCFVEVLYFN